MIRILSSLSLPSTVQLCNSDDLRVVAPLAPPPLGRGLWFEELVSGHDFHGGRVASWLGPPPRHGLGGGFGVDCWCWSFRLVAMLGVGSSLVRVGLLASQWVRSSVLLLRGGGHSSVGRWLSLGCEGPRVRIGGLGRRFPESGGVLGDHASLCSCVVILELLSFSSVGDVQMVYLSIMDLETL
ncbi:hypothetical protein YC2023_004958 [Brassica napus]